MQVPSSMVRPHTHPHTAPIAAVALCLLLATAVAMAAVSTSRTDFVKDVYASATIQYEKCVVCQEPVTTGDLGKEGQCLLLALVPLRKQARVPSNGTFVEMVAIGACQKVAVGDSPSDAQIQSIANAAIPKWRSQPHVAVRLGDNAKYRIIRIGFNNEGVTTWSSTPPEQN